jgi:hypothetical protein
MVNKLSPSSPGPAYWLLIAVGLPLTGVGALLVAPTVFARDDVAGSAPGVALAALVVLAGAVLLGRLPRLRAMDGRRRTLWVLAGGLIALLLSAAWAYVLLIFWLVAFCHGCLD